MFKMEEKTEIRRKNNPSNGGDYVFGEIVLYAIGGADQMYRVLRYERLGRTTSSIPDLKYEASCSLMNRYPNCEHVYAMANRNKLDVDYRTALKENSIESWAIFKDILEREGIRVY